MITTNTTDNIPCATGIPSHLRLSTKKEALIKNKVKKQASIQHAVKHAIKDSILLLGTVTNTQSRREKIG